ncbi:hypothetical protein [Synechococcus sp. PCC 7336]|uniref:hypothetical protein n=1 Tax=Synechococcus sp. PCC 7336 TaxID=195250 RepID=UPI0003606A27|nr:hypothetical protein [Synechococcus sp. PCC 7336]
MKDYSAYLILNKIDQSTISLIKGIANRFKLEVDIGENYFEFDYSGRDKNHYVVRFFAELAAIIVDCKGEIICEIINDEGDNSYEFFSIENGELFCQPGEILRGVKEKVSFSG